MARKSSKGRKRTYRKADPMIQRLKAQLAAQIDERINTANNGEGMTQMDAGVLMGVAPSQVSLITTGKLAGFSTENLMLCLSKLGHNLTLNVAPSAGKTGKIVANIG
jgi:predicted XRE-type DNA-binding protein